MKACPTCNRTYADETLTFCLVDGSVLSAPYDPHQTLRIPPPRSTDPAPTEVLNPPSRPSHSTPLLPSTIQSPQTPPLYTEKQQAQLKEKRSANPWMVFGIAMSLVSIVAVGTLLNLLWFEKDRAADDRSNRNLTNTHLIPSPTPTATLEGGSWGPVQQASINQGDGQMLTYYGGTTPERCQADCDKNPGCRAFTFIRPGAYNPGDPPMCYLMSEANKLTPSPCCISAIKR
jgi:PAN domain